VEEALLVPPASDGAAPATAMPTADPAPATTPATAAPRKTCLIVVTVNTPRRRAKPGKFL
jgi:hypothetical protein